MKLLMFIVPLTYLSFLACAAKPSKTDLPKIFSVKSYIGTICIPKTKGEEKLGVSGAFRGSNSNRTGPAVQLKINDRNLQKVSPSESVFMKQVEIDKEHTISVFRYDGEKQLLSFKVWLSAVKPHLLIKRKPSYGTWSYESLKRKSNECQ